ncbi:MAG TPA: 3-deoxy-manno-octulosonate cytidylyltransferase [Rhizomicrobium sp.]|nr:3-deoxy-manno-octulosonate cytidylyltransferase [Rhizomicrobium sp.]
MKPILLIPARLAATRLPAKPLADIAGVPMIVRVVRQAMAAELGPVVVAAGDREIVSVVEAAGGNAVLTDPALPSGSDRIHAALQALDPDGRHDVAVNLQGDLPALEPAQIRAVVSALEESGADIATLAAEIIDPAEHDNPNVVKAVVAWGPGGRLGRALYFTRATAPTGDGPLFHHVGIYAYRCAALARFVGLPPSPLEKREKLEQLRALEANMSIAVARVDSVPLSVDTEADLAKANQFFARKFAS